MLSREAAALAATARQADTAIRPLVLETPLVPAPSFSRRHGADVWFKLENEQVTGSFKLRGAVNKLLALSPAERARGVVAASSGNHGAAVSYAAAQLGVPGAHLCAGAGGSGQDRQDAPVWRRTGTAWG